MSEIEFAILEKSSDVTAAPVNEVAGGGVEISADHICEFIEGSLLKLHCSRTQSSYPMAFDYLSGRDKLTGMTVYNKENDPVPVSRAVGVSPVLV